MPSAKVAGGCGSRLHLQACHLGKLALAFVEGEKQKSHRLELAVA
ncbi:MAG: hypothetical protein WC003_08500 [Terrimicrobiaceae bacterium]